MSCISEEVARAEDIGACRRVGLLLKLQDARRDLDELRKRRTAYLDYAEVCKAEACATENMHRRIALNSSAVRFQLDAEADYMAIWELTQTIGSIERALSAGPVVLTAEQCAAVDDTMGVAA